MVGTAVKRKKKLLMQNFWKNMQQPVHKYHMASEESYPSFWLVDFVIPVWYILNRPPEGCREKAQQIRSRAQAEWEVAQPEEHAAEEATTMAQLHAAVESPTPDDVQRRTEEVRKAGLQSHPPTQQLAQWLQRWGHWHWQGRNQPKGNSSQSWEARPHGRNSWRLVMLKRPWKYWPGIVSLQEICQFKKVHNSSYVGALFPFGPWDCLRNW